MFKLLLFFVIIELFIHRVQASYTARSTTGFVCGQDLFYNSITQRCEINLNGINPQTPPSAYNCDYLNQFAEYTDSTSLIRCSSCKYYKADLVTQSLICQECDLGFSLLQGQCLSLSNNVGCKELDIPTNPAQIQCKTCQQSVCQICIKKGWNYCTQTNPSNSCECQACSDNFVLDPNGSGCIQCPYNGCLCSATQSGQNIAYTCNSCILGYYMDVNSDGANQCYSCESKFGASCNTCTKQQCTQCKDFYYLGSNNKCVSCYLNTNCNSSTNVIGCSQAYYSLFQIPGVAIKICKETDKNAIANPLNLSTMQCKSGFTNFNGECILNINLQNQSTDCGPFCSSCLLDTVTEKYYCTACQQGFSIINTLQKKCIGCSGDDVFERLDNDIFLFTPDLCYTSMHNPRKDPNCLNEFGFTTNGVCLVCVPGYKLVNSVCVECITSSINGSLLTITYACTSQSTTLQLNITPYSVNLTQDPQTQPQFYSAILGIPSTLLKNLQIEIIKQPKPTDDNTQNNNNNESNESNNSSNLNNQNGSSSQSQQSSSNILTQIILLLIIFTAII